jgi:hypothetical protein
MFTNKTTGTVIASTSGYRLGYHSCDWTPCCDAGVWSRLASGSTITLVQEDTR